MWSIYRTAYCQISQNRVQQQPEKFSHMLIHFLWLHSCSLHLQSSPSFISTAFNPFKVKKHKYEIWNHTKLLLMSKSSLPTEICKVSKELSSFIIFFIHTYIKNIIKLLYTAFIIIYSIFSTQMIFLLPINHSMFIKVLFEIFVNNIPLVLFIANLRMNTVSSELFRRIRKSYFHFSFLFMYCTVFDSA